MTTKEQPTKRVKKVKKVSSKKIPPINEEKYYTAITNPDLDKLLDNSIKLKENNREPILYAECKEIHETGIEIPKFIKFGFENKKKILEIIDNPKPLNEKSCPSELCVKEFKKEGIYKNTFEETFTKLRNKIQEYIYHTNPIIYDIVTLGSMCSYYPNIFDSFPYFDFIGAQESCGKSTFLECLTYPSYYSIFVTTPSTATLFRTLNVFNGMIGIDEIGKIIYNEELLAILLSGHKKGSTVPRCKADDYDTIQHFSVFGLKAWTRLRYVPNELLSRSITIPMVRNEGRKKLKGAVTFKDFEENRDEQYLLKLFRSYQVEETYLKLKLLNDLHDRTKDLFLPLLTLAKLTNESTYNQVLSYAKQHQKEKRAYNIDIRIVILLETLLANPNLHGECSIPNIRNKYRESLIAAEEINNNLSEINRITTKDVTTHLTNLGFKKTTKITGNNPHININIKKLEEHAFVYLKESVTYQKYLTKNKKTPPISQNLTNLTFVTNSVDNAKILAFIQSKSNTTCTYRIIHQELTEISGIESKLKTLESNGSVFKIKNNWRVS